MFEILRIYSDTNGRFIICDIKTEDKCITLNNDEPRFFQDFFDHVADFRCDHLIIGGDFNLVLDLNKDKKGGRYKTHTNSLKTLEKFIDELNLIDVWRVLNPDILRYTWRQKKPEIHCRLDFFLVEWAFIHKTLQHFNFGPLVKCINTFYNNSESCVLNNGWSSNFFKLERGVRQGCPLSPYLFILCVKILAEKIRTCQNIKGINVFGQEIKISQYADDTTLILDCSDETFTSSLQVLDDFRKISGLKLNDKKTEVLWIGANKGSGVILCPEKDFKWVKKKVKALGVWFSTNPEEVTSVNFSEKQVKITNCLSLMGKITVLKSLIASQLVYILSPLPTEHCILNEINKAFFNFLWNGKGDKIKRDIMIGDYSQGGLRMIDIQSFNKALKTMWVIKYLDESNLGKWKLFFDNELQNYGSTAVFKGNLKKEDLSKIKGLSDVFIKEILQIWSEISYEDNLNSMEHFLSMSLWHNSLIRIENRPVYYKEWYVKGITKVSHLMKDANTFLSFYEFNERYNIKTNFLSFSCMVSSLKSLRERCKVSVHIKDSKLH